MSAAIPLTTIRSFRDLVVWQRAVDLAVRVHQLTTAVSPRHRFSIAGQMDRAAISIASNIAEGAGRHHRREYRHFVGIARGSLRELETQLLIGARVGAFTAGDAAEPLEMAEEISKMLSGLARSLR